jgi:hypothetical protein
MRNFFSPAVMFLPLSLYTSVGVMPRTR